MENRSCDRLALAWLWWAMPSGFVIIVNHTKCRRGYIPDGDNIADHPEVDRFRAAIDREPRWVHKALDSINDAERTGSWERIGLLIGIPPDMALGGHAIVAAYSGDLAYAADTGTATLTITP